MNDSIVQEKLAYFHHRSQYVIFDDAGYVQDSCQTLFSIPPAVSLFDVIPFMEAMRDVFIQLAIEADISFLCIKTDLLGREGYYNFFLKRSAENELKWFVYDLTEFYTYLQPRQQEKNDEAIAGEYLRLQQRASALEKNLLQYQNEELQRIEQMKTAFFSQVSHEMRTPLNSIVGLSHLLAKQADPSVMNSVEALKTTAQHLSAIVNDVLDWGKLENNVIEIHNESFLIRSLIQNIVQSFLENCREKGITLAVNVADNVPVCLIGDTTRINQILYNILGNAIKFTHQGGIKLLVDIPSDEATSGEGLLRKAEQQDHKIARIRFLISDTGIGMSEEEKKRIANPYVQANDQVHRRYGGTGLGLSIVQKLVERLGGTWTIESQPGKGTNVTVHLPLPVGTLPTQKDEEHLSPFQHIRKVLVAEDDPVNRKVLTQLLNQWQLQTTVVENGKQALEHIIAHSYDLLILDHQMPEMDGAAVLQALPLAQQNIPVLILSGDTTQLVLPQRESGAILVLAKPVLPQVLQEKIMILEQTMPVPPIDLHYLYQITDNQSDLMIELIDTFIEQAPISIQQIREAWESQDKLRLQRAVHKAKPGFQYVGAKAIEQQLSQLEDYTRQQEQNQPYETMIQQLDNLTTEAIRLLEEERKNLLS